MYIHMQMRIRDRYLCVYTTQVIKDLDEQEIVMVDCGAEHTVCVSIANEVYGFGHGVYDQLGLCSPQPFLLYLVHSQYFPRVNIQDFYLVNRILSIRHIRYVLCLSHSLSDTYGMFCV